MYTRLFAASILALSSTAGILAQAPGAEGGSEKPAPEKMQGLGGLARPAGTDEQDATTLIPRAILFGNPDRAQGRLSPDGQWLAFLAPVNGVLNVHVAPASDPAQAKAVTSNNVRGVARFHWAYTSEHILYADDANGDENFRVYAVNVKTGEKKDLTAIPNVRAEIGAVSRKFPTDVIIGINDRDPRLHDLYRVNIETGERALLKTNEATEENPSGWSDFTVDEDYRVRLASRVNPDGSVGVFSLDESGSSSPFMQIPMEDTANSNILGFDDAGTTLYYLDSTGRDTSALYEMPVGLDGKAGEKKLLVGGDKADISGALVHPTTGKVQAVQTERERAQWLVLDQSIVKDLEFLKKTNITGDMHITSRSQDDRWWTVTFVDADGPAKTYLFDRGDMSKEGSQPATTFLFANKADLEQQPLVQMHPVIIKSRDGMELVSYYSLPLRSDPDGNGKPDSPLPMVLNVHGGPWARDSWGYDAEHQWLANRGYAVLSVNYRGSTGFGKKFLNSANLEWAGKMHDDLIDAVDWAVQRGIADPAKVAIYGGSYGGYATLVGLTFTPDKFACGVDIVGPSNLETLLKSFPPYWEPAVNLMTKRIGDHRTEEGRKLLQERSPLTLVDKIQRPLLIAQGANDPRVKKAEADQIVEAMKAKGLPVTYVLYPDEGHGFARPENRMSFYAVAEAFLAQHLGGRFEPYSDAFTNSSIQVLEGAEQVPGLADAVSGK